VNQVEVLENAILQRAQRLAEEYRAKADRSRDNILREASEKLRLKEDRETLLAKALAERAYRRKVQSHELKLQREMDHLRWNLVEGVEERLHDRLADLMDDEERYLPLLQTYLWEGATRIENAHLVAELNARDLKRIGPNWGEFITPVLPKGKRIDLSPTPIPAQGGVLIRNQDNRIRYDNTFEGRMERMSTRIHQTIVERLFPGGADHGVVFAG